MGIKEYVGLTYVCFLSLCVFWVCLQCAAMFCTQFIYDRMCKKQKIINIFLYLPIVNFDYEPLHRKSIIWLKRVKLYQKYFIIRIYPHWYKNEWIISGKQPNKNQEYQVKCSLRDIL